MFPCLFNKKHHVGRQISSQLYELIGSEPFIIHQIKCRDHSIIIITLVHCQEHMSDKLQCLP